MSLENLGSLVARLGGADKNVLAQVQSAKSRFFQMGLVLLSTSSVAVVSMAFALTMALRASLPVAVLLGFVWGFIILNIDRLLIQNIRFNSGLWRTLVMVLTRLAIASLLSVVISTPLVLQVFGPEIQTQMTLDNANQINSLGNVRSDSPQAQRLASDNKRIATDQAVLRGDLGAATSANVAAAQSALTTAEAALAAATKAANDAYQKMECELNGQTCDGGSGHKGEGPRYQALKQLYDIALANEANAQKVVTQDQQALQNAQNAAAQTNSDALAQAQAQANRELPGLIADRNKLQAALAAQALTDSNQESSDTGLLARIQALTDLGRASSSALFAHWAVAALLFMIELMPVLVKLLMTLGPPTLYDRVSELMDDSAYDAASRQRNVERRRIEQDSKKNGAIEADMRDREVKLGIRANAHVAGKMEEILDAALAEWSSQLAHTMRQAADESRKATSGAAKPADPADPTKTNGHTSEAAAVRSRYHLPKGDQL